MLGLVKESRLIKEKNKVCSLETELKQVRLELIAAQEVIATTENLRSLELKALDEKLNITRLNIDSVEIELGKVLDSASKEREKILLKASEQAKIFLIDAKEKASIIIENAESHSEELINKTNQECLSTRLIVVKQTEDLIAKAKMKLSK